jgi:hypothetical protein
MPEPDDGSVLSFKLCVQISNHPVMLDLGFLQRRDLIPVADHLQLARVEHVLR